MDNSENLDMEYVNEILTKKEYKVFNYLIAGKTNKEIAEKMVVTQHTVKAHVSSVLKKLKAKRRVELILRFKKP